MGTETSNKPRPVAGRGPPMNPLNNRPDAYEQMNFQVQLCFPGDTAFILNRISLTQPCRLAHSTARRRRRERGALLRRIRPGKRSSACVSLELRAHLRLRPRTFRTPGAVGSSALQKAAARPVTHDRVSLEGSSERHGRRRCEARRGAQAQSYGRWYPEPEQGDTRPRVGGGT